MGAKGEQRKAETFRRRVRQLLAAGMGTAAISKATGKSYQHCQRIVDQEREQVLAQVSGGQR